MKRSEGAAGPVQPWRILHICHGYTVLHSVIYNSVWLTYINLNLPFKYLFLLH